MNSIKKAGFVLAVVVLVVICVSLAVNNISFQSNKDSIPESNSSTEQTMDSSDDILISDDAWQDYLYTPTQIVKALDYYFIQDCWNGRILYSDKLSGNLSDWNTLTDEFKGGHSLSTDGVVLISDNSNNNQIFVWLYDKENGSFVNSQILEIDNRPHFVLFDEITDLFYVLSSYNGDITRLKVNDGNKVDILDTIHLSAKIDYARSMSFIDGYLYIPDGFGTIYKIDYLNDFDIVATYRVDDSIAGMNYLCKINDYYYLTVYTGNNFDKSYPSKFIRSTSIENIAQNNYEDLTGCFGFSGTPYFISEFDGKCFITEIDEANSICSFELNGSSIYNINYLFKSDTVSSASIERKKAVVG